MTESRGRSLLAALLDGEKLVVRIVSEAIREQVRVRIGDGPAAHDGLDPGPQCGAFVRGDHRLGIHAVEHDELDCLVVEETSSGGEPQRQVTCSTPSLAVGVNHVLSRLG